MTNATLAKLLVQRLLCNPRLASLWESFPDSMRETLTGHVERELNKQAVLRQRRLLREVRACFPDKPSFIEQSCLDRVQQVIREKG